MPRTSLPEIQRRYEINSHLASLGEGRSDAGAMSAWYNLDVGWLLVENQRLREALEIFADPTVWNRENVPAAIPVKATLIAQAALRDTALRALGQEQEAKP